MAEQPEEPAAEAEEPANASKDDSKDDEKAKDLHPERIPKEDPGDGLPTKTPDEIEFKWDKTMTEKKACDTQHMLYLLHLALDLVRRRTIERNKYFKSIGRTDRYINQLDNPQIITNFLDWHNLDKDKNKFDGALLETGEKLFMINEMISEIGGVKKGPATKIYTKLKKDVVIEKATWLELPQPKLKLQTWGRNKMYAAEKVIDECSCEDLVTLLTFENAEYDANADEKSDEPIVQGVLALVIANNKKKSKASALEKEADWQKKVVAYFVDNNIDGKTLMETSVKEICNACMNCVVPSSELNEKGKPRNAKLRGGVNQVLRTLKGCYVNGILSAAAAKK